MRPGADAALSRRAGCTRLTCTATHTSPSSSRSMVRAHCPQVARARCKLVSALLTRRMCASPSVFAPAVVQYFLSPLLLAPGFISVVLSNTLYAAALSYYHYTQFLGYNGACATRLTWRVSGVRQRVNACVAECGCASCRVSAPTRSAAVSGAHGAVPVPHCGHRADASVRHSGRLQPVQGAAVHLFRQDACGRMKQGQGRGGHGSPCDDVAAAGA